MTNTYSTRADTSFVKDINGNINTNYPPNIHRLFTGLPVAPIVFGAGQTGN